MTAPDDLTSGTNKPVSVSFDTAAPSSNRACVEGTQLDVYTGVWNRTSGVRRRLRSPATLDHRLRLGTIRLVQGASSPPVMRSMLAARFAMLARSLYPWRGYGPGLVVSCLAAVFLAPSLPIRRRKDKLLRGWKLVALFAPSIPLILGVLVVLEFVKDDAYISFRYAHNLVTGNGLVFNAGERLEGYTNFLWTMVMVPFEALGCDLFQVCEVLGTLLSIGVIVRMGTLAVRWDEQREDYSFLYASMWLATSSSWVLWAKAGLEQSLAALLPLLGAYELFRAMEAEREVRKPAKGMSPSRRALLAGIYLGLGCLTRPEIHLMTLIVGAPLLVEAIRRRRVPPIAVPFVVAVLALTVPFLT